MKLWVDTRKASREKTREKATRRRLAQMLEIMAENAGGRPDTGVPSSWTSVKFSAMVDPSDRDDEFVDAIQLGVRLGVFFHEGRMGLPPCSERGRHPARRDHSPKPLMPRSPSRQRRRCASAPPPRRQRRSGAPDDECILSDVPMGFPESSQQHPSAGFAQHFAPPGQQQHVSAHLLPVSPAHPFVAPQHES